MNFIESGLSQLFPVNSNLEKSRIFVSTKKNILNDVEKGLFREDLYYRLNVFPIRTVDLSKREEDIIPITVAMIKKHCENKKDFPYLNQVAQDTLKKHCWSGNVRELENVILRALVLSNNQDINDNHILVDDNTNSENNNYQKLEDKIVAMGN